MALHLKRGPGGRVYGKRVGGRNEYYLLAQRKFKVAGHEINVWHYWYRGPYGTSSIILFDKITTCLEATFERLPQQEGEEGEVYFEYPEDLDEDEDPPESDSVRLFCNEPGMLYTGDIFSEQIKHIDMNGGIRSGANTHSDGNLCLGEWFPPNSLDSLHMLLNYEGNKDLANYGPGIPCKKVVFSEEDFPNMELKDRTQYQVTRWPTNHSVSELPEKITGFFNR